MRTASTLRWRRRPIRLLKWRHGKPFTAKDVKCTWDLLTGKAKDPLKVNFRANWYFNLEEVTVNGDDEATFVLKRPQPALLALLASGFSLVYPCHVSTGRTPLSSCAGEGWPSEARPG